MGISESELQSHVWMLQQCEMVNMCDAWHIADIIEINKINNNKKITTHAIVKDNRTNDRKRRVACDA